jgi:hypothetical protein
MNSTSLPLVERRQNESVVDQVGLMAQGYSWEAYCAAREAAGYAIREGRAPEIALELAAQALARVHASEQGELK